MSERTDQTQGQPTPTLAPQPNRILAEPATPALCRADYQGAADIRARIDQQRARGH